jgi:hypothetical protein
LLVECIAVSLTTSSGPRLRAFLWRIQLAQGLQDPDGHSSRLLTRVSHGIRRRECHWEHPRRPSRFGCHRLPLSNRLTPPGSFQVASLDTINSNASSNCARKMYAFSYRIRQSTIVDPIRPSVIARPWKTSPRRPSRHRMAEIQIQPIINATSNVPSLNPIRHKAAPSPSSQPLSSTTHRSLDRAL